MVLQVFSIVSALSPPLAAGAVGTIASAAIGRAAWKRVFPERKLFTKTEDLVDLAGRGALRGRVHGRDWVLEKLAAQMGTMRGVILLIGPPGVGKTAIIEEIAYRVHEKAIPGLQNARILRFKSQEMAPAAGLIGSANQLLHGSAKDVFNSVLSELKAFNQTERGGKIILFVDEIHKLLTNELGYFDFSTLVAQLAELDQYGVVLVGATSSNDLLDSIQHHGARTGFALARRVRAIPVPEMTPRETITTLNTGIVQIGKRQQVTLTPDGVEALVYLLDQQGSSSRSRLPDSAFKFFEEVAQFTRNRYSQLAEPTLDSAAVIDYLHSTSPTQKPPEVFREQLAKSRRKEQRARGFFATYFPLLPHQEAPQDAALRSLAAAISDGLSDPIGQTSLIQTNSSCFVREAAQTASLEEARFRSISVETLLALYKKDPSILPHFLQALAQSGQDLLLIEDSAPFLRHLKEKKGQPTLLSSFEGEGLNLQTAAAAAQNLLEDPGQAIGRIAAQGVEAIQHQLPRKAVSSPVSPMLDALTDWVLEPGHQSVICVSSQSEEDAASLALTFRWPLSKQKLGAADVIDWLAARDSPLPLASIETLVFLVYRFYRPSLHLSSADFCYQVCQQIGEGSLTDDQLLDIICRVSKGSIAKKPLQTALAQFEAIRKTGIASPPLETTFPRLSNLLEESLQDGGVSLIKLEEADPAGGNYVAALLAHRLRRARVPLIQFDRLSRLFSDPALQTEYLKRAVCNNGKAFIFIQQTELPGGSLLIQEWERLGCRIVWNALSLTPPQDSPRINSLVEQALDRGARFLQQAAGQPERVPPPPWQESAFVREKMVRFDRKQFGSFFFYLLEELGQSSHPLAQQLCNGYFSLYESLGSSFSLSRVHSSLRVLLEKQPKKGEDIAFHLSQQLEEASGISRSDCLYAVDPSRTTIFYRMKRQANRLKRGTLQIILAPFRWIAVYADKTIQLMGAWFLGINLFSRIRALFGY